MLKPNLSQNFSTKVAPPTHAPLVLDVDTGRDDAWAIFGAFDEFEVAGIVSTYGNVPLTKTTRNSLDVTHLAVTHGQGISNTERNISVWSGAPEPTQPATEVALAEIARRAGINGNGLCNLTLPHNPKGPANSEKEWVPDFIDFLTAQPTPVNYVACGPLTNLANLVSALGKDEKGRHNIKKYINNVVVMGGSFCKSQAVDFNFKADPHAAQTVLSAFNNKVFLFPFDETKKLKLSLEQIETLVAHCEPARFSRDLMHAHAKGWSPDGNIMLHDPSTLLAFDDRTNNFIEQNVRVLLHGKEAGRTVSDGRGYPVNRFTIPEGQENQTRNLLLRQYLNLHLTA
jgi:inosine-uridine nucleoside N-ribohydrolase